MITDSDIIMIGTLSKPHGIKGEITATLDYDGLDLMELKCIVVPVDGINVPFFLKGVRPKSTETVILAIDGVDTDTDAKALCGNNYYALREDVDMEGYPDEQGGFLEDFIGFSLHDTDGRLAGTITDYDDSTDNVLFIVDTPAGDRIYVPVADELIENIDAAERTISMNLPLGLLDL
ncbi:MAG: 16S rRNA processing protein RimM [Firmicutes bacterium]|nr:16S rRNA processing protein RimM [Bacillota bacterium]MCM1400831.1 16S rRNA processing protein RimM [Bacteroides sp.]MCM1476678.1 16S rRNA processing protein RimM [Bacteroides sp.]